MDRNKANLVDKLKNIQDAINGVNVSQKDDYISTIRVIIKRAGELEIMSVCDICDNVVDEELSKKVSKVILDELEKEYDKVMNELAHLQLPSAV